MFVVPGARPPATDQHQSAAKTRADAAAASPAGRKETKEKQLPIPLQKYIKGPAGIVSPV
jgi:hypothetical protein